MVRSLPSARPLLRRSAWALRLRLKDAPDSMGLAIPLRIVEMLVGSHEVIDREIVLAVEEPRPAVQ